VSGDDERTESPESTDEVLGVSEVFKRYRDGDATVEAVAGVTLSLPRASLNVLVGPSGAGKTTLLGMLGGLVLPTRGDARIDGVSVVHLRDHHRTALRRTKVGFAFQDLALIQGMTLLENVLLPLTPRGGARKEDVTRAEALLERFGLLDKRERRVERLSGGERQRGAIARTLVLEPPILLLDEPTAHLDSENAAAIVDALVELRDDGKTVVAATHDARLAEDGRVDRSLTMRDGRLC